MYGFSDTYNSNYILKEVVIIDVRNLHLIKKTFKETDLILIIDKEGKVLYYNNYNDIHNKLGTEDVIGMSLLDVYPLLTEETSVALSVLKTGQTIINQPQVVQLCDGTSVHVINTAFPLISREGIIGTVLLSYDINSIATTTKSNSLKPKKQNLAAKYTFEDIISQNIDILQVINKLKMVSEHNSNIFIYGETGTGKELFAHAIHNSSRRTSMPFISQNCAAMPESLMESLIFGTTAGSFTGATEKKGLFELANGGTIFLDEINSMPLALQAKILRVIEDRRVRRIGGNTEFETDVRIIASTNESPKQLLNNNKFRNDLFYRLSVVNVKIPPLRERKNDIVFLCNYFIKHYNIMFRKNIEGIDNRVYELFMDYNWPGNVRELKHCIESAFNCAVGSKILLDHIPCYIYENIEHENDSDKVEFIIDEDSSLQENVAHFEKHLILKVLKKTENNIVKASNILGISRQSTYNKLKKYYYKRQI